MVHIQYVSLDEQKMQKLKNKTKHFLIFSSEKVKRITRDTKQMKIKCNKVEGIVCIVKKFEIMYDFSDD